MKISVRARRVRQSFLISLFLFNLCSGLFAASGASFLKLGVGARALGLGSAYTAVVNDSSALYWNPAGLAGMPRRELSATYAKLFSDSQYNFLAYAHPLKSPSPVDSPSRGEENKESVSPSPFRGEGQGEAGRGFTWGASVMYLNQGEIEGRGEGREKTADFSASDLAVTIGAGRYVTGKTALGLGLKLLQSTIAGYSSTGFALDAGSQYHSDFAPMTVGFAVQNMGPEVKFLQESYSLPLTLSGGVGCSFSKWVLVSADVKHYPNDSRTSAGMGTEVSVASMFTLRSGYVSNAARALSQQSGSADPFPNLSGFGFGLGIKLGSGRMDYSFSPAGELGNNQRISLAFKF